MDRIETAAHIEAEQEMRLDPLKLPDLARFQARKAINHAYSSNQALGAEIWPLFEPYKDIPPKNPKPNWQPFTFQALLGIIKRKGPQFIRETYSVIKEDFEAGRITNPLALFLWKVSQCQVELKEVELK